MNFNLEFSAKTAPTWACLWGLSLVYRWIISCRRLLYRLNIKSSFQSLKPVISIGNITVGGTGKSPVVSSILSHFEKQKVPLAVLTRGYGRKIKTDQIVLNQKTQPKLNISECGDETWMLYLNHPEVSFYIGANRAEAARDAQNLADLMIMDDGMQHVQLKRNIDICLVDAVSGFGNGHLLPLGPLREPLVNLNRTDIIIITKANLADSTEIKNKLQSLSGVSVPIFKAHYCPLMLKANDPDQENSIDDLTDKNCILVSGIGNPEGFEQTIRSLEGKIIRHIKFQDHYQFDEKSISAIESAISQEKFDYIVTTEKDFVKLSSLNIAIPGLRYVKMEMVLEEDFFIYLTTLLDRKK